MHKIANQSSAGTIPTEAIDEVARHLEASEAISFRSACKRVDTKEFHNVCIETEFLLLLARFDKIIHVLINSVYRH